VQGRWLPVHGEGLDDLVLAPLAKIAAPVSAPLSMLIDDLPHGAGHGRRVAQRALDRSGQPLMPHRAWQLRQQQP